MWRNDICGSQSCDRSSDRMVCRIRRLARARHVATPRRPCSGAALILVLWFVAALTLLTTAIQSSMRADVRATGFLADSVRAAALGDAAIQLALLEFETNHTAFDKEWARTYEFDGHVIDVSVLPDTAFVNLNAAAAPLLRNLLVVVAGVPHQNAEQLADNIVEWRTDGGGVLHERYAAAGVPFRPRGDLFVAPEDLIQVLGFDHRLYAKISPFVTVFGASGGVDPRFASLELLKVLSSGNEGLARRIHAAYRAGEPGVDTSMLEQSHLSHSPAQAYRVAATMALGGVTYTRARWVEQRPTGFGEPWTSLHVDLYVRGISARGGNPEAD